MRVLLFALFIAVASGSYLREEPKHEGEEIADHQVVNDLQKEVEKATTQLNDGSELEHNQQKNVYNAILAGWGKPAMFSTGHFKANAEKVVVDGKIMNKTEAPKEVPMMIPHGGFKVRAAGLPNPSGMYKPEKMVEHGKLKEMKKLEDEGDDESEEQRREKAAAVRTAQEGPACTDMENYLELAKKVRAEEELAKDGKEKKGLAGLVKLVCPLLKSAYGFIFRCTSCERMAKRIESFYGYHDQKVFPGKAHPSRCDQTKWPTKNFVLEAALSSPNIFFGVDFCAKTGAEKNATGGAAEDAAAVQKTE